MLGRESSQYSFLSAAWSIEALLDKDDFYGTLFRAGPELYSDDFFAECYTLNNGRPSIPPSRMMKLVLLQHWAGLSDRRALEQMTFDLRWKAVLGMEVDEPAVGQSTLVEFRARVQLHDKMGEAFERFLERAIEAGLIKRREAQVVDSTMIWGRGAVEDTYNFIASAVAKVLRAAAAQRESTLEEVAHDAGLDVTVPADKGSLKGRAGIDWSDEAERRGFLNVVVEEARKLLAETREDQAADADVRDAAELLAHILCQDLEPVSRENEKETGAQGPNDPELELGSPSPDSAQTGETEAEDSVLASGQEVQIRQGVAKDRVVSAHDPEMRHGRKSHQRKWDGYKGHFSVGAESEFVTGVEVTPANAGDAEAAKGMMDGHEEKGLEPEAWVGDMAYSAAELRIRAREKGSEVIAQVPPATVAGGRFSKDAFTLDLEAGQATCPAGETTTNRHWHRDGGGVFIFDGARCATCPLRAECTPKELGKMRSSGAGRTVAIHPHEELLQEARASEKTEAFKERIAKRPLVEQKIAHLMSRGLRQARYFGITKTRFQALATSLVVNLARLGRVLEADDGLWSAWNATPEAP